MIDIITIGLFLLGLVLLIGGAELLVRGASSLAAAMGISPLVIGLTIVAYGTSAPELAVSIQSGLSGQGTLALGNVIGSNIFNVLLILGVSATIAPLVVSHQLVRFDVPLMIGVAFLFCLLALDGGINQLDGALLFAGAIAYTVYSLVQSRKTSANNHALSGMSDISTPRTPWLLQAGFMIAGLAMLVLGSEWLVNSAVIFARRWG
jgi:cation:H+ antiporter